jgi:hypothetical protein
MSVSGKDKYTNVDVMYRTVEPGGQVTNSFSLVGGFKGSGWVVPQYNQTRVGLQRSASYINYFEGPNEPVVVSGRGHKGD